MLISRELGVKIIEEQKKLGKKIVFTNGCFDILHVGHLAYMNEAKRQGDILIVGVNSDESVKRLKGPTRPINSELDRAEMLSGLKAVDFTIIFTEDTPMEIIDELKP
ncbi:MAG: adenylyltransferase/cytidyltransferase family protein, partial [Fusobacteriaceae bacterium]